MINSKFKFQNIFFLIALFLSSNVIAHEFQDEIRAQLQARHMTELSSGLSAKVIKLDLKEGDQFKKGDILVGYDCALENAEAEYAKAELRAAKKNLASMEKLNKLNGTSVLELENARARTELANAKLNIEKVKLAQCTEIAPFDGVITKLYINKYQRVKHGEPIMSISSPSILDVEMRIPSKWLVWLKIGYKFDMLIDETDTKITGSIARIGGEVDAVSQSVTVYGQIITEDAFALPGMSGNISFEAKP